MAIAQDAKTDPATMKKEHEKAHAEHDAWEKQIVKWRVEHTKALAALREIEARILGHEASLEELAGHVADHEDHIRHHDDEITDHEKRGKGADHAKLAESHKQVMAEHTALAKQLNSFDDDHDRLVVAIQKLRDQLPKKP
jgi:chromosome segregation ATPase